MQAGIEPKLDSLGVNGCASVRFLADGGPRVKRYWGVSALVCALVGGCADTAPSNDHNVPGFNQLQVELFDKTCASSACHSGEKGVANLSFTDPQTAYDHLVGDAPTLGSATLDGLGLVVPGSPEKSLLYLKMALTPEELDARDLGAAMPIATGQKPGPKTLKAVHDWIKAGAPMDGADFVADWTPVDDVDLYTPCAATDPEGLKTCLGPNPDPEKYVRLYTPPLTIAPGEEKIFCSFLEPLEKEIRFRKADGTQMAGGHHVALFEGLTAPSGESSVDCGSIAMGSLRFVAGAGGAGGASTIFPQGISMIIPQGRRVVVQSHYINSTNEPMVVMDAVDLELTTLTESPTTADPFSVIDSEFEIPAGATDYTRVKECVIEDPIELHMLLGHTHDYGVLFTVDFVKAQGPDAGIPKQAYYATDGPGLRDAPEVLFFDEPVLLDQGDKVIVTCAWTNTTDQPLGWPEEMCVALMYYTPGAGFMMCDTQDISPSVDDGSGEGPGCMSPGALGNDKGVGKYCTKGGTECDGTPEPTLCLAEFSDQNYCSVILCSEDSECGEGAKCVFADAGSACLPEQCID